MITVAALELEPGLGRVHRERDNLGSHCCDAPRHNTVMYGIVKKSKHNIHKIYG
jgi:hypothetical protein